MDIDTHTPSLTHLRDFTRARSRGRVTHVAQDRAQVAAPTNDRFFAFAYERFISAVIEYVNNGCRGGALDRAVLGANDRMRASYGSAAKGLSSILRSTPVVAAQRRQRNTVVLDSDGYELVSLRLHLMLDLPGGGRLATFMYFTDQTLTPVEIALMETAVALAASQVDPTAVPAVIMVRAGRLHVIDPVLATAPARTQFLRSESLEYRAEWAVSA